MKRVIHAVEPRQGLLEEILAKSRRQEARFQARKRFWLFLLMLALSFGASVPVFGSLSDEIRRSGFSAFASLLFTNSGDVLSHWQEFGYSLLESLPIGQIIASLVICMAGLYASRSIMRESQVLLRRRRVS